MRHKKIKKLYIVGKNYGNETGGPAKIIRGLVSDLKNKNIDVQEICLNKNFGKGALIKNLLKILFFKRKCIVNVHTDGLMLPNLVYLFSRLDKRNKYFLTVHGLYYIESKMNGTYQKKYARVERKLLRKFPNILCVSELLKEKIEEDFQRTRNISVVPNGIDLFEQNVAYNNTNKLNTPIKLLMLGGIRERKGVFECVDVVKHLTLNGLDVNLNIYGVIDSEEIKRKFLKYVDQLGLSDKIFYNGNLSDKESVYQVIADSDVQLCLSKWDTFNVAIIESLAIGTPCISSNMCGASTAIENGVNGLVVDMTDSSYINMIADYIFKIQNNFFGESAAINNLKQTIKEKYSWDSVIALYLSAIAYKKEEIHKG